MLKYRGHAARDNLDSESTVTTTSVFWVRFMVTSLLLKGLHQPLPNEVADPPLSLHTTASLYSDTDT